LFRALLFSVLVRALWLRQATATCCVGLLLSLPLRAEPVSYFYSDLPPYEYSNATGDAAGIGITKVRKVLINAGFQPSFAFYSVPRGLNALNDGIDFTAVIAPTATQRQQLKISAKPIYFAELGVVRLHSTPALTSLNQLRQHTYLALTDTRFAFLSQRPTLTDLALTRYDVSSQNDAYRLLINGRYQYFLCYHAADIALSNPLLTFDSFEKLPVYLVLSSQHPDANRLMQRVNMALGQ
jgi:hypothetical protein